jgi:hypothetical protein
MFISCLLFVVRIIIVITAVAALGNRSSVVRGGTCRVRILTTRHPFVAGRHPDGTWRMSSQS